jgi:AraC-like DNA-binding protein
LFYVAVVSRTLTEKFENKEKYKNSNLGETEALQLVDRLDRFMNSQNPFTNPELKLKDLAETIKTTERNLSQVINEYKQQNFSDYINSYRVKYAMRLLSDQTLKEKTILWVLFEAGFNSKSSFNTIFKKNAGCTPAEFRKNSIQQN